jgi:hypothetical protein
MPIRRSAGPSTRSTPISRGSTTSTLRSSAEAQEHLAVYNEIDLALDPFPYNGTTTTCEALWMGVPVITLVGDRHAGRVGASLLHAVGFQAGIAATPEDYALTARLLASQPSCLRRRGGICVPTSPAPRFATTRATPERSRKPIARSGRSGAPGELAVERPPAATRSLRAPSGPAERLR